LAFSFAEALRVALIQVLLSGTISPLCHRLAEPREVERTHFGFCCFPEWIGVDSEGEIIAAYRKGMRDLFTTSGDITDDSL
jgi:hypothetical protein